MLVKPTRNRKERALYATLKKYSHRKKGNTHPFQGRRPQKRRGGGGLTGSQRQKVGATRSPGSAPSVAGSGRSA